MDNINYFKDIFESIHVYKKIVFINIFNSK